MHGWLCSRLFHDVANSERGMMGLVVHHAASFGCMEIFFFSKAISLQSRLAHRSLAKDTRQ